MWKQVYNRNGDIRNGGWGYLEEAIRSEHQPIIMIEMLEIDLTSKGNFILSSSIKGVRDNQFDNVVSDGSVDVDYDRGTRRTSEITILNPTADFTPTTKGFDSDGDWEGKIYINRIIRLWRGAKTSGGNLFVPVGTLMIDGAEVIMEQNMSLVNLTMSDMWKKLQKSFYGTNKKYPKDTPYNEIIRDMLDSAGVPLAGKYAAVIDRLGSRTAEEKRIGRRLEFAIGDSRGDKLKELVKTWNIDAYFDPIGVFRTEDRGHDRDKRVVWKFHSSSIDKVGRNGGLVSLTRSFNDDNLYNHVIVIGTGNEKNTVRATRIDNRAASKFSVDKIGSRVFLKESDKISTQAQANKARNRIWDKRIQFSETINAEVICNPALEADDVIRITELDLVKVDGNYRLKRFTVPLVTSKQTIEATNIIRGDDI